MKGHRVLIVDDDPLNRKLLESLLTADGLETHSAPDGESALAWLAGEPVDLVLLDIMMPRMDGFETARRIKADSRLSAIPIIMVTTLDDHQSRTEALEAGAEEFLRKPVDSTELRVRVRNLLKLKEYSELLNNYNHVLEREVTARTTELLESYHNTVYTLTRAAEYKDEDTGTHIVRVSHYAATVARAMKLDNSFVDALYYASPMHDVGKIGIPDHILLKPGPLTREEWGIMKSHCAFGANILKGNGSPYLALGSEIAMTHHERWDGSGYPRGLRGEEIPMAGRIMAVCDVYDALRSRRPYKPPFDHAQATEIILKGDGRTSPSHFDPKVLSAFESCNASFATIFSRNSE